MEIIMNTRKTKSHKHKKNRCVILFVSEHKAFFRKIQKEAVKEAFEFVLNKRLNHEQA